MSKTKKANVAEEIAFENRYVTIVGEISDKVAKATCEKLLALASKNDDPITIFISSPGGHVESGDMIHDLIKFIKPVVTVIGSGWVASAGALIFIGAELEKPFCAYQTRVSYCINQAVVLEVLLRIFPFRPIKLKK